jgi:putative endonuclease
MKQPCVYILSNRRSGRLYTGVTGNLHERLEQHQTGKGSKFVWRYCLRRLVWYELHEQMLSAIEREKQIKEWHRPWKVELIEGLNPDWLDLRETLNH